jgi:hypothetical protein
VYVQTAGPTDFQNVSGISFLPANFTIDEDNFSSITENSLVVFDDFSFKLADNKQAKINFLKIVNYILRHKKLTLILVIHNLLSNNLSNDILSAHHVFQKTIYATRWSLDFFQSVQKANYHFADVNSARNFIINRAENMFNNTRRAILFANKQTFLIHDAEKDCSQSLSSTEEKLIPPFLILYSLPILSKSILKFLMKDGSLIC